ncbi:MAG: redoxin domain-containing protein, partial [Gammaproteobacteria bacterium]
IGKPAPDIQVETWVQGGPVNISTLSGQVVLVEVFQVNCPGCFLHALPEALHLHQTYQDKGLAVIGLATAFEDFDRNNLANLELLVTAGELTGEPLRQLGKAGLLDGSRLDYSLPFPIGMDVLIENNMTVDDAAVHAFITRQLPDFASWSEARKQPVYAKARNYLESRTHCAQTFESFNLQGTPSSILVDREGILRDVSFGYMNHLEPSIVDLLK